MYYRVELSMGHCRRNGELLPQEYVAIAEQQALQAFTECFQGGQLYHRFGGYVSLNGCLMLEPCTIVFGLTEALDTHMVNQLWSLAGELGTLLEQESVLLVITA